MDMFDLFREPDSQNPNAPSQDSPPISTSNEETEIISPYSHATSNSFSSDPSTLPPSSRLSLGNTVIIGVPGSLVFKRQSFQLSWLTQLARSIETLRQKGWKVGVVVGESPDVRAAAHAGRQLGVSHAEIEQATRSSSQLHAALVLRTLAQAHPQVCERMEDAVSLLQQDLVPVTLGSKDTLSTEARAAMLAEMVGGKFVLFSDLEIPPNTITHARFSRMAGEAAFRSNQTFIVDALTALILARSKIETFLVAEKNVGKIESIVQNNEKECTRITSTENMPRKSIARGEVQPETNEFADNSEVMPTLSRPMPKDDGGIPPSPDDIARYLGR